MGFFPVGTASGPGLNTGTGAIGVQAPPAQARQCQELVQGIALGRRQRRVSQGLSVPPGVAHIVTVTQYSSSLATVPVSFPAQAQVGDLALIIMGTLTGVAIPNPSGWTAAFTNNGVGSFQHFGYGWWKLLTAADLSAGSVSFATGVTSNHVGFLVLVRGVDQVNPVQAPTAQFDITGPAATPTAFNYVPNALAIGTGVAQGFAEVYGSATAASGGFVLNTSALNGLANNSGYVVANNVPDHVTVGGTGFSSSNSAYVAGIFLVNTPPYATQGPGPLVVPTVGYQRTRSIQHAALAQRLTNRKHFHEPPWKGYVEPSVPFFRGSTVVTTVGAGGIGSTIVAQRPTGVQQGDLMILGVHLAPFSTWLTSGVPSDWTFFKQVVDTTNDIALRLYWRYVTSNDQTTQWNIAFAPSSSGTATICAFGNVQASIGSALRDVTAGTVQISSSLSYAQPAVNGAGSNQPRDMLVRWNSIASVSNNFAIQGNLSHNYSVAFYNGDLGALSPAFSVPLVLYIQNVAAQTTVPSDTLVASAGSPHDWLNVSFLLQANPANTGGAPPPPRHHRIPSSIRALEAVALAAKASGVGRTRRFDPPWVGPSQLTGCPVFQGNGALTSPGNVSSITLPFPAGLTAGAMMLAYVVNANTVGSITPPAGWVGVPGIPLTQASIIDQWFMRIATAADVAAGSATWTVSAGNTAGIVLSYTGAGYALGAIAAHQATNFTGAPVAFSPNMVAGGVTCNTVMPWEWCNLQTATFVYNPGQPAFTPRVNNVHVLTGFLSTFNAGDISQSPGATPAYSGTESGSTSVSSGTIILVPGPGPGTWTPSSLAPARNPGVLGRAWQSRRRGQFFPVVSGTPGGISPTMACQSSGTIGTAAGTPVNLPLPSCAVAGDLLVLSFFVNNGGSANTIILGSSMTTDIGTQNGTGSFTVSYAAGHKVLTSTDISNGFVQVTTSQAQTADWTMTTWRNFDAVTPIAFSAFTTQNSAVTSQAAPTVASNVSGSAILSCYQGRGVATTVSVAGAQNTGRVRVPYANNVFAYEQDLPLTGMTAGAGITFSESGAGDGFGITNLVIKGATQVVAPGALIPPTLRPARMFPASVLARDPRRRGRFQDAGVWSQFAPPVTFPGPLVGDRVRYSRGNRVVVLPFRRGSQFWSPAQLPPTPTSVVQYRDSTQNSSLANSTVAVTFPAGGQVGDLCLVLVANDAEASITAAGWQQVQAPLNGVSYPVGFVVLQKYLTAADVAAGSTTFTASASCNAQVVSAAYYATTGTALLVSSVGSYVAPSGQQLIGPSLPSYPGEAFQGRVVQFVVNSSGVSTPAPSDSFDQTRTASTAVSLDGTTWSFTVFDAPLGQDGAYQDQYNFSQAGEAFFLSALLMPAPPVPPLLGAAFRPRSLQYVARRPRFFGPVSSSLVLSRNLADGAAAADSLTQNSAFPRTQADGAGAADALAQNTAQTRGPSDGAGAADSLSRSAAVTAAVADGSGSADALARQAAFLRQPSDGSGASDILGSGRGNNRLAGDGAGASDTLTFQWIAFHAQQFTANLVTAGLDAVLLPPKWSGMVLGGFSASASLTSAKWQGGVLAAELTASTVLVHWASQMVTSALQAALSAPRWSGAVSTAQWAPERLWTAWGVGRVLLGETGA